MQAVYLCPEGGEGDVVHEGDFPWDAEDGNHGVPEELFFRSGTFPVFIEYDSETGHAEWWPPMMCGPPPTEAPWSHPDAASTLSRMEMFALLDAYFKETF